MVKGGITLHSYEILNVSKTSTAVSKGCIQISQLMEKDFQHIAPRRQETGIREENLNLLELAMSQIFMYQFSQFYHPRLHLQQCLKWIWRRLYNTSHMVLKEAARQDDSFLCCHQLLRASFDDLNIIPFTPSFTNGCDGINFHVLVEFFFLFSIQSVIL